jgi:autotransporter-associated beta strand protein
MQAMSMWPFHATLTHRCFLRCWYLSMITPRRAVSLSFRCLIFCAFALVAALNAPAWQMKQPPLATQWTALVNTNTPLPEYPRPQMVRSNWLNLNGIWQFQPGATNDPVPTGETLSSQILVPYPMESAISGVMQYSEFSWYRRTFAVPAAWSGERIILHLDAVNWQATVYINGQEIGVHQGGYDPFSYDITPYLNSGTNELIVGVYSPEDNAGEPRGKQTLSPGGIMYTSSSGIWQPAWLEPVDASGINDLQIVPDVDDSQLRLTVNCYATSGVTVGATVLSNGVPLNTMTGSPQTEMDIPVPNANLWSPTNPFLYGLQIWTVHGGVTNDSVASYFGMRKISIVVTNGVPQIYLNNQPFFEAGPLDQGFWPDGIYTAPTDAALEYDLQMEKALGFNMVRKHIKVERQRWYYWADTLGILVWQDMPSCNSYTSNQNPPPVNALDFINELTALVTNHWNSPSIIMWDVFNEGQGQQNTYNGVGQTNTAYLVQLVKTLDPSRLVNQASGGNYYGVGDVYDDHNYPAPGDPMTTTQAPVDGEYGGINYKMPGHLWNPSEADGGYTDVSTTNQIPTLFGTYVSDLINDKSSSGLNAAVYTEITDVENECNGLMTYDRWMKPATNLICALNQEAISTSELNVEWIGGTADYDTPTDWRGGTVPDATNFQNAVNDNGTNNAVEINNGDPDWTINDIRAGDGAGNGAFVQNGQTVTVSGWFRMGVISNDTGIYTLNGGTLTYDGSDFNIGELGTGILNINGGTITDNGNGGNIAVALGGSSNTDIVNQTSGTINTTGQLWVGNGNGPSGSGVGIYNFSGGAISVNNWVAIGRSGGIGTFVMSGGVFNQIATGENFLVGTGYGTTGSGSSIGTLNQSGGTINCLGEFLIPEMSPSSGTYNISGTASLIVSNWLAVGRESGAGTLNMSGGSITKGGDNTTHLDIGASGDGVLTQTGGVITNIVSDTWLGESGSGTWNLNGGTAVLGDVIFCVDSGASGTLNLNGGIFNTTGIINSNSGTSTLNFNGGTLQAGANNTNFLSGLNSAEVNAGGAVIDSQGYNITIPQDLIGSGGLTKLGSGTLYLAGVNDYTGTTLISGGNFIATAFRGPVTVGSGGTLSFNPATVGTMVLTNTLTLLPGSTTIMRLTSNDNDQFAGLPDVTYGGTLVVTNVSTSPVWAGEEFKLFNSETPGSGNFSSVVILPTGSGTFDPFTGILTVTSTAPTFNPPTISSGNIILAGSGGTPSAGYTLLMTTNIALPLSDWMTNASGTFNSAGTFSNSVSISPGEPALYFILRIP